MIKSAELFAGGGGLVLGTGLAGAHHVALAEWDRWACKTLRNNLSKGHPLLQGAKIFEGDVRTIDWGEVARGVDLLAGGPPCQPFSAGGLSRAADDPRDMFPAMTDAIQQVQPRAFIIENVKGLTRKAFAEYYAYIKLRLSYPTLRAREGETWVEHLKRLQIFDEGWGDRELSYRVVDTVVDAADFGVPQRRHRVFLVGFRADVRDGWSFPPKTHSGAALKMEQLSGNYFDRHQVPSSEQLIVKRASGDPNLKPWLTIRDAIYDMPSPRLSGTSGWLDHKLQLGAKAYPGHTGSPIDEPSKALKAGGHGVPGGENMIRFPDGSVRYYSIREAARVQTFPDEYALHGAWGEAMRQLGNAVPVKLAQVVSKSVVEHLEKDSAGTVS
ncbi:DNA cytosine methyltransferase [Corynebacterium segmentosum]|uniref:DNA cytosine methyltransferase n=1 Tax=Corynebacterium accolens TaxID=38284 RepID=UPI00266FD20C|nr:DNA cytosine methyltransferase [Corynebacterium accolens]WKS64593.1 DNA cytosine methyltransferase [Corynebacterium accolens]